MGDKSTEHTNDIMFRMEYSGKSDLVATNKQVWADYLETTNLSATSSSRPNDANASFQRHADVCTDVTRSMANYVSGSL